MAHRSSAIAVAKATGDSRKRGEMLAAGLCRNKEQERQIDRFAVDRIVRDRSTETREEAEELVKPLDPRVGQGEPAAKTRRAEVFAGAQRSVDRLSVEIETLCGAGGEILEELRLAGGARADNNAARIDERGEIHNCPSVFQSL
jgi:hypothetical protein